MTFTSRANVRGDGCWGMQILRGVCSRPVVSRSLVLRYYGTALCEKFRVAWLFFSGPASKCPFFQQRGSSFLLGKSVPQWDAVLTGLSSKCSGLPWLRTRHKGRAGCHSALSPEWSRAHSFQQQHPADERAHCPAAWVLELRSPLPSELAFTGRVNHTVPLQMNERMNE